MQFKQGEDGNYIVDEAKTKAKQDAAREEAKGGRCCGANRTDEEIEKIAMAHWNTVYETERCQCGWQISQEDHDLGNYPNGKISPCVERLLFQEAVAFNHRPYEQTPSTMVMSTISQDSGFWDGLFGTCCCARCGKERHDAMREKETSASVFCSELAGHLCMEGDLIDKKVLSQEYLPKDFSTDPNATVKDHYIPWEDRFGQRNKDPAGKYTDPEFVYEMVDEFRIVRKLRKGFSADGSNKVSAMERANNKDKAGGGESNGRSTFTA